MTTNAQHDDESPLLVPVDRVAFLLQVSKRTVWRLVSAGKLIKPRKLGGGIVRWHLEELKAWIARDCYSL